MKKNLAFLCAVALVLWLLHAQATRDLWIGHLRIDPVVYQARANWFLDHGSWADLGTNEYQPGALWFFVSAGVLAADRVDFDSYLRALFAVNMLLLCVHVALALAAGGRTSGWLMLFFAAVAGPILLFRFELLASALVLGGWACWRRGHFVSAAALLGMATATKIYPVLLFPLLCVSAWRACGWRKCAAVAAAWGGAGLLIVGSVLVAGASWADVTCALRFHFDKPFGIDGVLGTLLPLVQAAAGIALRMAPRNGVYGFDPDLGPIPVAAIEWVWLIAVLWTVARLVRASSPRACSEAGALFVVTGLFVGLGKLMTPQYAWWAMSFVPLASAGWFRRGEWWSLVVLLCAGSVLAQFVYPLNYSNFIACFDSGFAVSGIFWANALKNILWLCALGVGVRALLRGTRMPETAGTPAPGVAT